MPTNFCFRFLKYEHFPDLCIYFLSHMIRFLLDKINTFKSVTMATFHYFLTSYRLNYYQEKNQQIN